MHRFGHVAQSSLKCQKQCSSQVSGSQIDGSVVSAVASQEDVLGLNSSAGLAPSVWSLHVPPVQGFSPTVQRHAG